MPGVDPLAFASVEIFDFTGFTTYPPRIMWKQYTRETMARPGWATGAMVIAFAATIGLAQWTTGARKFNFRQAPADWPIAFTLPDSLRWTRYSGEDLGLEVEENAFRLTYVGRNRELGSVTLYAFCDPSGQGPSEIDPVRRFMSAIITGGEFIRMGPFEGLLTKSEDGDVQLHASAVGDGGMKLDFILVGGGPLSRMKTVMIQLCESVELVNLEKKPASIADANVMRP